MRILFSTSDVAPENGFRRWRETIFERIVPTELRFVGDGMFEGAMETADIGPLLLTRATQSAVRTEATPATIRGHGKSETLNIVIALRGELYSAQDDRTSIQRAGDFVVLDRRPTVMASDRQTQTLFIEVPRERVEGLLGPTRRYTALTVGADLASTSLMTAFFDQLTRVDGRLPPDPAARMASIGIDLIVASIAERLAREPPRSLHGTLIVQRAKAYVEANLGDQTLDPPHLAAAVGVSLRHLQQLFHEHGRHVSDWIWQRRLDVAARRLVDPGCAHLSIGALAYGCGFVTQAHFSHRFRSRYGMTPSEYRWRGAVPPAATASAGGAGWAAPDRRG